MPTDPTTASRPTDPDVVAPDGSRVREEVVDLRPGGALTIPVGTHFQFRATGSDPLTVVAVTMPPWSGDDEAVVVEGRWSPTVSGS